MSQGFLSDRERALENEFFYQVDQKLREQLRREIESEKSREALAKQTGIQDEAVLDAMVGAGITPETLLALTLVPLIEVAWADRIVEHEERKAILEAAEDAGVKADSPSRGLLEQWLDKRPPASLLDAWKDYIEAICQTMPREHVQSLRDELIERARTVAKSAGGVLGIGSISKKEQAALANLERAFPA